jgi:FkbM family methyltransferase
MRSMPCRPSGPEGTFSSRSRWLFEPATDHLRQDSDSAGASSLDERARLSPTRTAFLVTIRQALGRCYRGHVFFRLQRVFPRRSYAQYGEDLVLSRLLGRISSVIDIGANDGVSGSNTFLFVLRGARALLFEPIPEIFNALREFTACAADVTAVNEGISNCDTELEFAVHGDLSFATDTEDEAHSEGCRRFLSPTPRLVHVAVRPLSYWIRKLPQFAEPDFVSIDVEGHELNVLEGVDLEVCRPRALVLETHGPSRNGYWLHRDYEALAALLRGAGYAYALSTLGNSIWIRAGDPASARVRNVVASEPHVFADAPEALGDAIQSLYELRTSPASSGRPCS